MVAGFDAGRGLMITTSPGAWSSNQATSSGSKPSLTYR
jgi:hypothetical protein